jgi:polysaccharide export outer membrane protein
MRAIMCNQDVVFVANAASVDVTKFLDFLNVIMVTGSNGMSLATQVRSCRGAGGTTTVTRIQ